MTRLQAEHRRLYLPPAATDAEPTLIGKDGLLRVLVVSLHGPADWALLAPLWRGVQAELGWPAPAIAVNGRDAFELWFSLAEPLPFAEAARLLAQLQRRYLGGVRPQRLRAWPGADVAVKPPECPPFAVGPERWAAFIAPDLPAVFGDDPALDVEPGADSQAELLARQRPIRAAELRQARAALELGDSAAAALPPGHMATQTVSAGMPAVGRFDDPCAFLLTVMNDEAVPLALRIEAAKGALLRVGELGR